MRNNHLRLTQLVKSKKGVDEQIPGAWFVMAGSPELHDFEDFFFPLSVCLTALSSPDACMEMLTFAPDSGELLKNRHNLNYLHYTKKNVCVNLLGIDHVYIAIRRISITIRVLQHGSKCRAN